MDFIQKSAASTVKGVRALATSKPRAADVLRWLGLSLALTAVAVAGRIAFAGVPNVQPVTAICVIAGAVFGRRCGATVGIATAFFSNMVLGQGWWTLLQMAGWGLAGWLAGTLDAHGVFGGARGVRGRKGVKALRSLLIYGYGFVAALLYGALMDSSVVALVGGALSPETILGIYAAGLPYNLVHAISTVCFLIPLCATWRAIGTFYAK